MELIQIAGAYNEQKNFHPALQKVQAFIEAHDFSQEAAGTHQVSDDFFYNIIEMTTTTANERVWESHKAYYDVHYILSGKERLAYNFLSHMQVGEYIADEDYQQMTGKALFDIILEEGQLLLFDPNDGHQTGLKIDEVAPLRKIVFKVKI